MRSYRTLDGHAHKSTPCPNKYTEQPMNRRLLFAPALALLVLMYLLQGCASERPRPLPNEAVPDLSGNVGYVLVSVTKNAHKF